MANPFISEYDPKPYLTILLTTACLIVTLPTMIWPELRLILGGTYEQRHDWLLFTATFQHGIAGIPASIHLIGNLILLWIIGPKLERLLGQWRYGLLILFAIVVYALGLHFSDIESNGISAVIWALGPPIFVALREAKRLYGSSLRNSSTYQVLANLLIVMYVVITLVLVALPYLNGFRGHLIRGFWMGNMYHVLATLVGIAFALLYRRTIHSKLLHLSLGPAIAIEEIAGIDIASIGIGVALNSLLLTVVVLSLF